MRAFISAPIEEAYDEATSEKRMAEIEQNENNGEHYDAVNHPKHYTSHPSGVECIDITQHMGFCLGNAMKYIWRADLKNNAIEDLNKAKWYIDQELKKRAEKTIKNQSFVHPLADD